MSIHGEISNPDEVTLEQARSDREGAEWLRGHEKEVGPLLIGDGTAEAIAQISQRAFDMIVGFEVTSQQLYEVRYRKPIWPEGESGVTIGIGYDVGYASRERLRDDWAGVLPSAAVSALEAAIGVTGQPARALAQQLGVMVDVPWGAAITVHRTKVVPRWTQILERSLPNADKLSTDCSGALVSLIYNRGASFQKDGDRYREMRNIHAHMTARAFAAIPQEIRSMRRLWPTVAGLQSRRDREAALFEQGLA